MTEFLERLTSWEAVGLYFGVAFLFGFAPGAALRLIVKLYPRDHPRRHELVAELYAVPRFNRPTWVFEQLEVTLFEAPTARRAAARTARRRRRLAFISLEAAGARVTPHGRVFFALAIPGSGAVWLVSREVASGILALLGACAFGFCVALFLMTIATVRTVGRYMKRNAEETRQLLLGEINARREPPPP